MSSIPLSGEKKRGGKKKEGGKRWKKKEKKRLTRKRPYTNSETIFLSRDKRIQKGQGVEEEKACAGMVRICVTDRGGGLKPEPRGFRRENKASRDGNSQKHTEKSCELLKEKSPRAEGVEFSTRKTPAQQRPQFRIIKAKS